VVVKGEAGAFRCTKAIPTAAEPCLTCHGSGLDPALKAEIERLLYPDDQATSFKAGELRGAFTVTSRPRGREAKQAFYRLLTEELERSCGIVPSDVVVSIIENTDEDWSFGLGRAQFLTGEL